jgi:hypothetical protein
MAEERGVLQIGSGCMDVRSEKEEENKAGLT